MDSDDTTNGHRHALSAAVQNPPFTDSKLIVIPTGQIKREMRRRPLLHGWLHKKVSNLLPHHQKVTKLTCTSFSTFHITPLRD